MPEAVPLRPKKSTTGRFILDALRATFTPLSAVAPDSAARAALHLFMRPHRLPPRTPRADGLETHSFRHRSLRIWDWGDGPTILLAHGWSGSASQLTSFVAPLVRAGFYVAAPDLPAHGHSAGRTANVRSFADALLDLGHRLGPVHAVIGHSLGGTAAAFAAHLGLRAEALVLLGSPARFHPFAERHAAALGLTRAATASLTRQIEQKLGGPECGDLRLTAHRQTARLLALHDLSDAEVPAAETRELAALWPGARFEELRGLGHRGMLRDAETVRRVTDFVTELRRKSEAVPGLRRA